MIRYTEVDDLAAEVRELTGGTRAWPPSTTGSARTTFDASLASLRRRGMLVLFGASSGPVPPVDPQRLNAAGSVFLTRPKLYDYIATRDELIGRAAAVYAAVADGTLTCGSGSGTRWPRPAPRTRTCRAAHHRQAAADPLRS